MTQEEKAKAYDKALKIIRECTPDENGYITIYPQEIFPTLEESEDERIRKMIINTLNRDKILTEDEAYDCVAWLDKQKPIEHFELKAGHWYICHRPFCCRADHLTVKEGERILCEKDGVVKGFVIKDAEKYFKECNAPAPYEDEQKPKWSEEDSLMIDSIIDTIKWLKGKGATDMKIEWLESLKQRME